MSEWVSQLNGAEITESAQRRSWCLERRPQPLQECVARQHMS